MDPPALNDFRQQKRGTRTQFLNSSQHLLEMDLDFYIDFYMKNVLATKKPENPPKTYIYIYIAFFHSQLNLEVIPW